MRFIEDHQIPLGLDDLLGAPGSRRKRERADDVLARHPRIGAAPTQILHRCAVEDFELLVELRPELTLPLQLEARGHDDQYPANQLPGPKLLDDQASLDRLPESDLIGQDHARL